MVSVITPTFNRHHTLGNLYRLFAAQTYPKTEWLVYDDSPQPSPFFASLMDDRVTYVHSAVRKTIAEKRNSLVEMARGRVIIQFDDDDYYASQYIEKMLRHLGNADLVTLSAWFVWDARARVMFYWDTRIALPVHFLVSPGRRTVAIPGPDQKAERMRDHLWGYGFSYVFRREIHETVRFDDAKSFGEDLAFVQALTTAGFTTRAVPDEEGLAVHTIHSDNMSRVFPNYSIPSFLVRGLFGDALTDLLFSDPVIQSAIELRTSARKLST